MVWRASGIASPLHIGAVSRGTTSSSIVILDARPWMLPRVLYVRGSPGYWGRHVGENLEYRKAEMECEIASIGLD